MEQFIEFVKNHWQLWLAFAGIIGLITFEEIKKNFKGSTSLSPPKVVQLINNEDVLIIDIREQEAFAKGHIIGAINILPANFTGETIPEKVQNHGKDKFIVLVDSNDVKTIPLGNKLRKAGFGKIYILAGGITAWKGAALPLVKV